MSQTAEMTVSISPDATLAFKSCSDSMPRSVIRNSLWPEESKAVEAPRILRPELALSLAGEIRREHVERLKPPAEVGCLRHNRPVAAEYHPVFSEALQRVVDER